MNNKRTKIKIFLVAGILFSTFFGTATNIAEEEAGLILCYFGPGPTWDYFFFAPGETISFMVTFSNLEDIAIELQKGNSLLMV